ncbi:MAG: fumarate/nitrate reduction transcriptional regulator Fnr [Gammaproteobacteria bacterium]|nr:fumarate/nitrate reduction transcriptional regulator Fnr [Gammaproteobacteria bacterium]
MNSFVSTYKKSVNNLENISCKHCALYRICLPKEASECELYALDNIIDRQHNLKRNTWLFNEGDPFKAIYAIKSGCIKTYRLTPKGKEQVCGFYLPGDIIALDAIETGIHTCSAKIIQATHVCAIPYKKFETLSQAMPGLQQQLVRIMSREIASQQWFVTLLGKKSAEERVAAILCNLSDRLEVRGYSPNELILGMSRHDLGDYLGLAIETISRVLGRFHQDGLLTAKGKHIQLHQPDQLRALAGYS